MPMENIKIALTVAGSDSCGGAGIQADLKTFQACGVYGASALTCLTAQNTGGVRAVHAPPADFLLAQLEAVFSDVTIAAAKTGMLYSPEIIQAVGRFFAAHSLPLVVDPVMVATSGDPLLAAGALEVYRDLVFPHALLLTPNLPEAAMLTGRRVESEAEMKEAALEIRNQGPKAVLVKGGHAAGRVAKDLLFDTDGTFHWLEAPLEDFGGQEVHGSGCTLSAAITAFLAQGDNLLEACGKAKRYVTGAIQRSVAPGKGARLLSH